MVDPSIEINDSHIPDQFHIHFDNSTPKEPNNWTMMYDVVLTKEGMIDLRDKIDKMLSDYYEDEEEETPKKKEKIKARRGPFKMREIAGRVTYVVTFPFDIINVALREATLLTDAAAIANKMLGRIFNTEAFKNTDSITLGNPSTSLTVSVDEINTQ